MTVSIPEHSRVLVEVVKALTKLKHSLKHLGRKMLLSFASRVCATNFGAHFPPTFHLPSHLGKAHRGLWVTTASLTLSSSLLENHMPTTTTSAGSTAEGHPCLG